MRKLTRLRWELSQLDVLAVDMTALTQAEESLAQREMELRAIVEAMRTGLMKLNGDIIVDWVNDPMAAMFDLRPDEMVDRHWYELVPAMEQHRRVHERAVRGEVLDFSSVEISLPDGHRCFEMHYRPLRDRTGSVSSIYVIAADITGRKRAEQALREAEPKYRRLAVKRKQQVIQLERQINELLEHAGERPAYHRQLVWPR